MKVLLLVPFHERGYSELAKLIRSAYVKVYLPIPIELCKSPELIKSPPCGFSGYLKVWSPVLEALSECSDCVCYGRFKSYAESLDLKIKLLALIIKARALGSIDPQEWLRAIPSSIEASAPLDWRGILVVDSFVEYTLLRKSGVALDRVIKIEELRPTPLELLLLAKTGNIEWRCSVEALISWVVRYIGDYVVTTTSLSEAYNRLVSSNEYLDLVNKCCTVLGRPCVEEWW